MSMARWSETVYRSVSYSTSSSTDFANTLIFGRRAVNTSNMGAQSSKSASIPVIPSPLDNVGKISNGNLKSTLEACLESTKFLKDVTTGLMGFGEEYLPKSDDADKKAEKFRDLYNNLRKRKKDIVETIDEYVGNLKASTNASISNLRADKEDDFNFLEDAHSPLKDIIERVREFQGDVEKVKGDYEVYIAASTKHIRKSKFQDILWYCFSGLSVTAAVITIACHFIPGVNFCLGTAEVIVGVTTILNVGVMALVHYFSEKAERKAKIEKLQNLLTNLESMEDHANKMHKKLKEFRDVLTETKIRLCDKVTKSPVKIDTGDKIASLEAFRESLQDILNVIRD